MIITTKFHDISFEELRSRHPDGYCVEEMWNKYRGRPVSIIVPPVSFDELGPRSKEYADLADCKGPFFMVTDIPESPDGLVCPCTVEID